MSSRCHRSLHKNSEGSLQVTLLLILMITVMTGFGLLGLMRHWRFVVERQLRLNRCVAEVALDLRSLLNEIFQLNDRIQEIRAAILAAALDPPLIPPLRAAAEVLVQRQNYLLLKWKGRSGIWILQRGCGEKGDWAPPLPNLQFERLPPDTLGPQILRWPGGMVSELSLEAHHRPRIAAARISKRSEIAGLNRGWQATWCPPRAYGLKRYK